MKLVSVPVRLGTALSLLALSILGVGVQSVLRHQASWWNLPIRAIEIHLICATLLVAPLIFLMTRGKQWALSVFMVLATVWWSMMFVTAVVQKNFWLSISNLTLGVFWYSMWSWIRVEMSRSYFDPQLEWYQALPKAIPGLRCTVVRGEEQADFQVGRMDRDGAFIFKTQPITLFSSPRPIEARFEFRGLQMNCPAELIFLLESKCGVGIRFQEMSVDVRKRLGDFIERLRGEGYA